MHQINHETFGNFGDAQGRVDRYKEKQKLQGEREKLLKNMPDPRKQPLNDLQRRRMDELQRERSKIEEGYLDASAAEQNRKSRQLEKWQEEWALVASDPEGRSWLRDANARDAGPKAHEDVLAAHAELSKEFDTGGWVGLRPLRERLAAKGYSREQQDQVLRRLALTRKARFIPQENLKVITPSDQAAALHLAGEDKHIMGVFDA